MKLSVIVPCFNESDTIGDQLEALTQQQWSELWKIIFSDNGSTDDSRVIAERYQECQPNLRIVDASARQGQTFALNKGTNAERRSNGICRCG